MATDNSVMIMMVINRWAQISQVLDHLSICKAIQLPSDIWGIQVLWSSVHMTVHLHRCDICLTKVTQSNRTVIVHEVIIAIPLLQSMSWALRRSSCLVESVS